MRNYEGQKALLERDDYFIKTYMHEDEVAGFVLIISLIILFILNI